MRVCTVGESVQGRGGGALLHPGWLGQGERGQERRLVGAPGSPRPAPLDGRPAAAAGELSLAPGPPLQAVRARSLPLLELPLSCQTVKHLVPPSPPPRGRKSYRAPGLPGKRAAPARPRGRSGVFPPRGARASTGRGPRRRPLLARGCGWTRRVKPCRANRSPQVNRSGQDMRRPASRSRPP